MGPAGTIGDPGGSCDQGVYSELGGHGSTLHGSVHFSVLKFQSFFVQMLTSPTLQDPQCKRAGIKSFCGSYFGIDRWRSNLARMEQTVGDSGLEVIETNIPCEIAPPGIDTPCQMNQKHLQLYPHLYHPNNQDVCMCHKTNSRISSMKPSR